jgi:acetylornithine deacetylase/succinyl-diaminopimelate desuccinylase-like protein
VKASQAASMHGTNEYIDIQSYEDAIEVTRKMMMLGTR